MRIGNKGTEHLFPVCEGIDVLIADTILKRILQDGQCPNWGFEDLQEKFGYHTVGNVLDRLHEEYAYLYKKGDYYYLTSTGVEIARKGIKKYNRQWKFKNVYMQWIIWIAIPLLSALLPLLIKILVK